MRNTSGAPTESSFKMPPVSRVRAHYASLCPFAAAHLSTASLAACFLLVDSVSDEGDTLLIAASIAGAASLVIEARTEMVRHCIRNGIVDVAIDSLDEALSILKSEIRKRQPIAVLVESQPLDVLAEMVELGAQPGLIRWASLDAAAQPYLETLRNQGARLLSAPEEVELDRAEEVHWRAESSTALRQLDLLAGQVLPQHDVARQNWVAHAPRYLPRAFRLERRVQMTSEESTAFLGAVEERARQDALVAKVIIEARGQVHTFGA